MANYKTETLAYELADELARRTGLPAAWAYASGIPTVTLGAPSVPGAGGVTIQIKDQRNEADEGWDALPGFNSTQQPVYTTGVAKVVSESQGTANTTVVAATGTLTIGGGTDTPFTASANVVIGGVTLTEGVHFAQGANDGESATNIAFAINNHPVLKNVVTAVATVLGAGLNSTVVVTAKNLGAAGNTITTTETATSASWGAGTLASGAGNVSSSMTTLDIMMKIWAALAKRGLKTELWQTTAGTAPTAGATSYLQAEFWPNEFWTMVGLV